jgi:hypothetical protein
MLDFAARIETGARYEAAFIKKLKAEGWTIFAPGLARLLPQGSSHPKIESPEGDFIGPDIMAWPPGGGRPLVCEVRMKSRQYWGGYILNAEEHGRVDRWRHLQGAQDACGGVCVVIADCAAREWLVAPVTRLRGKVYRQGDFWILPRDAFDNLETLFSPMGRENLIEESYDNEWPF